MSGKTARKITPEVMRAETLLARHSRAHDLSIMNHSEVWQNKRRKLIAGFSADVAHALVALKVLTGEDIQDAAEWAKGGP